MGARTRGTLLCHTAAARRRGGLQIREREFFIDNLLVRIHFIIVMIRWTGLAPCELSETCMSSSRKSP